MKLCIKKILTITLLLAFVFVQTTSAFPNVINIQGKLTDPQYNAQGGTHNFTFRIYNLETGGSFLWSENMSINMTQGVWSHLLGSNKSLNLDFSEDYWVEVVVNRQVLFPRFRLGSLGYAYRANYTNFVGNIASGGNASGNFNVLGDLNVDFGTFYVNTSSNRVGIGTSNPNMELQVIGNANFTGSVYIGGTKGNVLNSNSEFFGDVYGNYNNLQISSEAVGIDEINSSIAGIGLSGASGQPLSVVFGYLGNNAAMGNTTINISAGVGLLGGGTLSVGYGGTIALSNLFGSSIDTNEITNNAINSEKLAYDVFSLSRVSGGELSSSTDLVTVNKDIKVNRNLYIVGNISNVNVVDITVNGSIVPYFNNQFDLGMYSKPFRSIYLGTNITAPIFYDSDNQNYFLNPAGNSAFNALTVGGYNVLTSNSGITIPANNVTAGTFPQGTFIIPNLQTSIDASNITSGIIPISRGGSGTSTSTGSSSLVLSEGPTINNANLSGNIHFFEGIWNSLGDVGIGTKSPQQRLSVNGSVSIRSGTTTVNITESGDVVIKLG